MSSERNCTGAVDEVSTAGSLLLASKVNVESGLTILSFETWLERCVTKIGGEKKITSRSVDTAGLQGAKDRKSACRSENTVGISSLDEQPLVVSEDEEGLKKDADSCYILLEVGTTFS